ncbi:hypothetical protein KM043_000278 [Ampulex compressa]|nr:hypothetical protein KM043_000278 [Ampulex compressa]
MQFDPPTCVQERPQSSAAAAAKFKSGNAESASRTLRVPLKMRDRWEMEGGRAETTQMSLLLRASHFETLHRFASSHRLSWSSPLSSVASPFLPPPSRSSSASRAEARAERRGRPSGGFPGAGRRKGFSGNDSRRIPRAVRCPGTSRRRDLPAAARPVEELAEKCERRAQVLGEPA